MTLLALGISLLVMGSAPVSSQFVVCPKIVAPGLVYNCFCSTFGIAPPSALELVDLSKLGLVIASALPVANSPGLYSLAIPPLAIPGKYTIQGAGTSSATIRAAIRILNDSSLLMVESDKALYMQGETARFRVLTLNLNSLLPTANVPVNFSVISPGGVKLMELNASSDKSGVANFDFPIIADPQPGLYMARAIVYSDGNNSTGVGQANFSIDAYVPPKFLVNVSLDQAFVVTTDSGTPSLQPPPQTPYQTVTGKVSANYPFGDPVISEVLITVWKPISSVVNNALSNRYDSGVGRMSSTRYEPGVPLVQQNRDELYKSVAFVVVQLTGLATDGRFEVKIPNAALNAGQNLIVQASARSNLTLERFNATTPLFVQYQGVELLAHLQTQDGQNTFKAGLPTTVSVRLLKPDGLPVLAQDAASVQLALMVQPAFVDPTSAASLLSQYPLKIPIKLDAAGSAEIDVPTTKEDMSCCNILGTRTTYQDYRRSCGCCATSYNVWVEGLFPGAMSPIRLSAMPNGIDNLCLNRAYSPTGQYIAIQRVDYTNPLYLDDNQRVVTVLSTVDTSGLKSQVEYMLIRAGLILAGGSVTPTKVSIATTGYFAFTITIPVPPGVAGEMLALVNAQSSQSDQPLAASAKFVRPFQMAYNLTARYNQYQVAPLDSVQAQFGFIPASTTPSAAASSLPPLNTANVFVTSTEKTWGGLGPRESITQSAVLAQVRRVAGNSADLALSAQPWRQCKKGGLMASSLLPNSLSDMQVFNEDVFSDISQPYGATVYECPRPIQAVCPPALPFTTGVAAAKPSGLLSKLQITKVFPRNWIWADQVMFGTPPVGSMSAVALDPIATKFDHPQLTSAWSLEAFATCPQGIMSAVADKSLVDVKPLVLSMSFPNPVIRGEEFDITFAAFGGDDGGQVQANVNYVLPESLVLLSDAAPTPSSIALTVRGNTGNVVDDTDIDDPVKPNTIRVRATDVGIFNISATANGLGSSDALALELRVQVEGIPVRGRRNHLLDLSATTQATAVVHLDAPEAYVPDSLSMRVAIGADVVDTTRNNLDHLIDLPTLCGEQNIINMAPSVYVGKYLTATRKLDSELKKRLISNIIRGYEREMTFYRSDGSFSPFGQADTFGSTWLTAVVLNVFAETQHSRLFTIDTSVMLNASRFLIGLQQPDGSFKSVGNVVHKEMLSFLSGPVNLPPTPIAPGGSAALTAFVTLALKKVQGPTTLPGSGDIRSADTNLFLKDAELDATLSKARAYLQKLNTNTMSIYDRLLRLLALGQLGAIPFDEAAQEALQISNKSSVGSIYDMRWWVASGAHSIPSDEDLSLEPARALTIETTGYGVSLLTLAGMQAEALQGVRWLLEQRNALGGFMSTADTVVALNALASYASATASYPTSMNIQMSDGMTWDEKVQVDENSYEVPILKALPPNAQDLTLKASGSGIATVSVDLQYNLMVPPTPPCYDFTLDWLGPDNYAPVAIIRVCAQAFQGCQYPHVGGMTIMSIGLFTGYSPVRGSLTNVTKSKPFVKRWEISDGRVDFYIDELDAKGFTCLEFNASRDYNVGNIQHVMSQVYNYYAPDAKTQMLSPYIVAPYIGAGLQLMYQVDAAPSKLGLLAVATVLASVLIPAMIV